MENLLEKMRRIIKKHDDGELDRYEYMSQIHEFNKLLLGFQDRLRTSVVDSIEITSSSTKLNFSDPKMSMYIDGSCGSAPITCLNFGNNEHEELQLAMTMLNEDAVIFDVGAHLGWYSLILGKKFPNTSIYAFEPIPRTFQFLQKNLSENHMLNVISHNYGLYSSTCQKDFYYFKGGSAIASLRNLIDHDKIEKITCSLKKMDDVSINLNITRLDFLKCDVEGAEKFVFEGGSDTIKRFLPIIFTEICGYWCEKFNYRPDELRAMLENWGYRCFSPHENSLRLQEHKVLPEYSVNYNYFFLHTDRHKSIIKKLIA